MTDPKSFSTATTMPGRMPALSISRPWPAAILAGVKPTENRTWATKYRGPVLVHGAQSWARDAVDYASRRGLDLDPSPNSHPSGLLGVAVLTGICDATVGGAFGDVACRCQWAVSGQYHWQLTDPHTFREPVACPGRLGLWWPTGDLRTAVDWALADWVLACLPVNTTLECSE